MAVPNYSEPDKTEDHTQFVLWGVVLYGFFWGVGVLVLLLLLLLLLSYCTGVALNRKTGHFFQHHTSSGFQDFSLIF